jgi:hypothetical protein
MRKIFLATGFVLTLSLSAVPAFAQIQARSDLMREIQAKLGELNTLEKRLLSPSEEDQAAHVDFLRQRDTGLIRLLPREKYDADSSNGGIRLTTRGGGAYYSFSRLSHEYGSATDIQLEQGYLSSGFAGANYGILTSLGDVPLENVSTEMAAVQFLATHAPAADEPKARIEQRKWGEGATIEGIKYAERLPLKVDTTYVLRSIDFSSSDVLVAFRVVRVDGDGSAILLWKILNRYPVPHLAPLKLH